MNNDKSEMVTVTLTREQAEAAQHLLYNVQSNGLGAYEGPDKPKNMREQLKHVAEVRQTLAEALSRR